MDSRSGQDRDNRRMGADLNEDPGFSGEAMDHRNSTVEKNSEQRGSQADGQGRSEGLAGGGVRGPVLIESAMRSGQDNDDSDPISIGDRIGDDARHASVQEAGKQPGASPKEILELEEAELREEGAESP